MTVKVFKAIHVLLLIVFYSYLVVGGTIILSSCVAGG